MPEFTFVIVSALQHLLVGSGSNNTPPYRTLDIFALMFEPYSHCIIYKQKGGNSDSNLAFAASVPVKVDNWTLEGL